MQLFFEIVEGDRQGARFQIKPGLSIGRRNADIILRDSKVSSKHAMIQSRGNNSLYLIDNESSNGLKVNGEKLKELLLTPGTKVQLGRTVLLVVDLEGTNFAEAPIIETWWETLGRLAVDAKASARSEKKPVAAFNPLLKLKFLQGPQTGTVWTIGYGPRLIGRESVDLRLEEPGSPDVSFELHPHRESPRFQTEHPDEVKLNGKALRSEALSDGDVIEIYKTRIQVILKFDE